MSTFVVQLLYLRYRDLLDRWKLWSVRALLDIEIQPKRDQKPPPQVCARCGFCGRSLPVPLCQPSNFRPSRSQVGSKTKVVHPISPYLFFQLHACPDCKKPLPKCSVCQMPLACVAISDQKSAPETSNQFPFCFLIMFSKFSVF